MHRRNHVGICRVSHNLQFSVVNIIIRWFCASTLSITHVVYPNQLGMLYTIRLLINARSCYCCHLLMHFITLKQTLLVLLAKLMVFSCHLDSFPLIASPVKQFLSSASSRLAFYQRKLSVIRCKRMTEVHVNSSYRTDQRHEEV
jgi:hypothetical protein